MDFLASMDIDIGRILMQYTVLLFSLCFHEAAHAWMSDRLGDYTARYMGRVTLNPIAHIDPIGTVLFPLLQFFSPVPLIGWAKPVPVNPVHLRHPRRDHMWIAAAGPFSNLMLGVACIVLLIVFKVAWPEARTTLYHMAQSMNLPPEPSILSPIVGMLFYGVVINLALAFFNLLPIPPLDGNWIVANFLPYNAARIYESLQPYGFLILYGLMFLGVLRIIFVPISFILTLIVYL